MARVTCRCGETLNLTTSEPERVTCPKCGAKIRVRRTPPRRQGTSVPDDGYLRFNCPCGRRLKVRARDQPEAGKCPDCGRIVPVPDTSWQERNVPGELEDYALHRRTAAARTADMDAVDLECLERWASRYQLVPNHNQPLENPLSTASHHALNAVPAVEDLQGTRPAGSKNEAGLRVCSRCGKPLHMSATVCRSCGEAVPKR
jgi:hypothetical protein